MYYVISYPALGSTALQAIEVFRRNHEPMRAQLVRAHITLVFGVRSVAIHELRDHVGLVAMQSQPFPISLDRLECWHDPASGESKLFLMVGAGRETLKSMHHQLYKGLSHEVLRTDILFDPHVTVATAPFKDQIRTATAAASTLALPFSGQVEALDIVSLDEGRLRPIDHIRLGGHRTGSS